MLPAVGWGCSYGANFAVIFGVYLSSKTKNCMNNTNTPPLIDFDIINLNGATIQRIKNFCPTPAGRKAFAGFSVPGLWRLADGFSVRCEQESHGIWIYTLYHDGKCLADCIACVVDKDAKAHWNTLNLCWPIQCPEVGYLAFSPKEKLFRSDDLLVLFSIYQYVLYWKFKCITESVTVGKSAHAPCGRLG